MFDIEEIATMQVDMTAVWHDQADCNPFSDLLSIACLQHRFNYELWHQEDIARDKNVSDTKIAKVKRAIDRLNQQRNDWIEKIDDYISAQLVQREIKPKSNAAYNSETPGSIVDRMSIMSLRIYHLQEQLQRDDATDEHFAKVTKRLEICHVQRQDLKRCLIDLVNDFCSGLRAHRTYRQFKMYNDPTMNPYLYQQRDKLAA